MNVITTSSDADQRWGEALGERSRGAPRQRQPRDADAIAQHASLQATLDQISRQLAIVQQLLAGAERAGHARPPVSPAHVSRSPLTPRQIEVLELVAAGRSTESIAAELWLSVATVRNHIARILRALNAHSRLEAVAKARELGLL